MTIPHGDIQTDFHSIMDSNKCLFWWKIACYDKFDKVYKDETISSQSTSISSSTTITQQQPSTLPPQETFELLSSRPFIQAPNSTPNKPVKGNPQSCR